MKNINVILLVLLPFLVFSQKGKQFPDLEGETLEEKSVFLPKDTKGKVTLVGVAYSKKSDKLLKAWFEPTYTTFIEPPKSDFIPSFEHDVNIYFVGLLKGLAKAASGKIETVMNKKLDKKLHKYTVISKVKIKPYKQALKLGKKDLPYFFVLDPEGKIVYNTEGAYTSRKLQEIEAIVEKYQD